MSQIYKAVTSGGLPPSVPTSFVTDSGTAVPAANILNVLTSDTSANNDNGIQDTGSGNTVTIFLTNRVSGSVTTVDATPTTLVSFAMPVIGVYAFDVNISSFNTTDVLGGTFSIFFGMRSTGAAAVVLNLEDEIENIEVGNTGVNISLTTSGNSVIIQATGIAAKVINWNAVGTYVFVGV